MPSPYCRLPASHGRGDRPRESQGLGRSHSLGGALGCDPKAWLLSSVHTEALSLMASDQQVATCPLCPDKEPPASSLSS